MKVKWVNLVDKAQGHIDQHHYVRRIPGNNEEDAVCQKPTLSEATKKKKASLPHIKEFTKYTAVSKAILHDAERRAAWQARYDAAMQEAKRHNKPMYGRLCDYVRHEVSVALKKGEEII